MPLIGGVKMSCEPCIRGHRSTKCTHANERLMVPVRKPGRPLSQCPHMENQPCNCSNVVAAIPRKSQCHCGSTSSTQSGSTNHTLNHNHTNSAEVTSPTKSNFRVDKGPRSRKQSFDPEKLARMDMNNVNLHSVHYTAQSSPSQPGSLIYDTKSNQQGPALAGFAFPYPSMPLPYSEYSDGLNNGTPPIPGSVGEMVKQIGQPYREVSAGQQQHPRSCCAPKVEELSPPHIPLDIGVANTANCSTPKQHTPSSVGSTAGGVVTNGVTTSDIARTAVMTNLAVPNGNDCCAPRQLNRFQHSPSASSGNVESNQQSNTPPNGFPSVGTFNNGLGLNNLVNTASQMPSQDLQSYSMALGSTPFPPFQSQNPTKTVYTYPPNFGSFENPLKLEAWRDSVQSNSYMTPSSSDMMNPLAYNTTRDPGTHDTIHTCNCGEGCSCVGCAAHPYNKETQEYVHSAWSFEQQQTQPLDDSYRPRPSTSGKYETDNSTLDGNGNSNWDIADLVQSPTATTPASNGSEEQLSAEDFFFVNYPVFPNAYNPCLGDMQNCPCGDDCQCLGCEIHTEQQKARDGAV